MGIFDTIKDNASNLMNQGNSATSNEAGTSHGGGMSSMSIMGVLADVLQQHNGVSGLMEKFQSHGLGSMVQSWIGNGSNMPISSDQISQVLGSDTVNRIASKMGVSPEVASKQVSEHLPNIVDRLTPNGAMPQGGFNKESLMAMAGSFFKKTG